MPAEPIDAASAAPEPSSAASPSESAPASQVESPPAAAESAVASGAPPLAARAKIPPPAAVGRPSPPVTVAINPNPKTYRWPGIVATAALGILIVAGACADGIYLAWRNSERIAPGLWVEDRSLAGLTRDEARTDLQQRCDTVAVTFVTPEQSYTATLKELGGKPAIDQIVKDAYWYGRGGAMLTNIRQLMVARQEGKRMVLPVEWDKPVLRARVRHFAADYDRKPIDAGLSVSGEGVEVVSDKPGRALDAGATLQKLQDGFHIDNATVDAAVSQVPAKVAGSDLFGTDVELADYPTRFDSWLDGRTRNLHIAAAALNGRVLMPGKTFSFNSCTGERTWDKGYRMAHIFEKKPGDVKASVVEGLAGGVCQVSSTLFNAVRRSNSKVSNKLRVVEWNHHSLPVTYVPKGLDATVAWPDKDFRFRNTLPYPIFMRASIEGEHLRVGVWAHVPRTATPDSRPLTTASLKTPDPE